MNELLSWYGYDSAVDSDDTQDLDLHRFSSDKHSGVNVSSGASIASLNCLKLAAAAAVHARAAAVAAAKGLATCHSGGVHRDTPSNESCDSTQHVRTPSPGE